MNQPDPTSRPLTAVILCRVLELEIEHFAADCPRVIHIEKLEQGLHNEPAKLQVQVQQAIDRIERETAAEVIVLGYGLCSRGTERLRCRHCRLIVPRAHDCITLLLGDKERYAEYVAKHPGTYWYSPGWIKHHLPPGPDRQEQIFRKYCEQFGEDNARYLMDVEQQWHSNYDRAAYVDVGGIGASPGDVEFTRRCADWLGWHFDQQAGDPDLLRELVQGPWDARRFVVVPPGQTVRMTGDDRVIEACD